MKVMVDLGEEISRNKKCEDSEDIVRAPISKKIYLVATAWKTHLSVTVMTHWDTNWYNTKLLWKGDTWQEDPTTPPFTRALP
jgi:hypothetical protein